MYYLLSFLLVFLSSTAYLNLAIGSINLVPLFITDGGRIVSEEFGDYFISKLGKKRGKKFAVRASMATSAIALALVLANLLLPPFLRFLPTVMGFVS